FRSVFVCECVCVCVPARACVCVRVCVCVWVCECVWGCKNLLCSDCVFGCVCVCVFVCQGYATVILKNHLCVALNATLAQNTASLRAYDNAPALRIWASTKRVLWNP